jgi:5-methylcytosine-specific restriction endonuclease McrA
MPLDSWTKRGIRNRLLPLKSEQWEFVDKNEYYHSIDWDHLRSAAVHRDGIKCQDCGAEQQDRFLEVHHLRYPDEIRINRVVYINAKADQLENLTTLCRNCHRLRHGYEPLSDEEVSPKPCGALYVTDDETIASLDFSDPRKLSFFCDEDSDEDELMGPDS